MKYNNEILDPLPLDLPPGARRHHGIYQDESSFHANDMEEYVYLLPHEQELQKRGRGRLVHVSDFIIESTGRLVVPASRI